MKIRLLNANKSIRFDLGSNSIILSVIFTIISFVSFKYDFLQWSYIKGLGNELSFFLCLFSVIFGLAFYYFWNLGQKSLYTIHLATHKLIPSGVYVIFSYKKYSFGLSTKTKTISSEFPKFIRAFLCIGIFFNLALITLDNSKFIKLEELPEKLAQNDSDFCETKNEETFETSIPEGCELIMRAYKLGYAKDLGECEPKKIDKKQLKVCLKRRNDEPFLHYAFRQIVTTVDKKTAFFEQQKWLNIKKKFDLQLQKLDLLRKYQAYAISAAPRASNHIWTNLPYPNNYFVEKYREIFRPNACVEEFQNQTNTVYLSKGDKNKDSKLLEHIYGQLLFNPKNKITVGFCKEYKIHWNAPQDICDKLATNPLSVLSQEDILPEIKLLIERHKLTNEILNMDDEIRKLEKNETTDNIVDTKRLKINNVDDHDKTKAKIVKTKIAKSKQDLRKVNEVISFQCLIQDEKSRSKVAKKTFSIEENKFTVKTKYFKKLAGKGETEVALYNELSRLLESNFHYSRLSSRSEISTKSSSDEVEENKQLLNKPLYLLSRLEILKNVDIFLGNDWVLDRDDLLEVYPYHVHLQNYVKSFRKIYMENHGRL